MDFIDLINIQDAGDTLEYFGQRRTDLNVASKFQGVETYSQIRYVHYFQEVHRRGLKVIPSRPMRIMSINITGQLVYCSSNMSPYNWLQSWRIYLCLIAFFHFNTAKYIKYFHWIGP